jgi:uncharacterized RDD family membrane protein YckC
MSIDFEPAYSRYPLATVNQRLGALIVDFLSCWFISELILSILSIASSSPLRFVTFLVTWFLFRVLVAARGQGQSFGRWLMSIRVIDAEYGKTADFGAFVKREIFVFVCSLFLIETITSTLIVFAWIPFVADAAFAIVDNEKRQAFHDRVSSTISIQSRKGFAINEKLGKLFNQAGQQATKLYQSRSDNRPDNRQNNRPSNRQNSDIYEDEYDAPRARPKRRPRSKTRAPQDFDNEYDRDFEDNSYRDSGESSYSKSDYPKNAYRGDIDTASNWNEFGNDDRNDARNDDQDIYPSNPYEDQPPVKRSARRPRRR